MLLKLAGLARVACRWGEQVGEVLLGRGLAVRTGDRDDRRATPSALRRLDLDGRAGRLTPSH